MVLPVPPVVATGNGTATGGTGGFILAPTTVRTTTRDQPVAFSLLAYIQDLSKDDYFETYATSTNSGDIITIQDLSWLLTSQ